MTRAQDGDRRAYEALLIEVTRLVRDFARHRLARADGAEDVVQETLLSIHRARHTYDPGRPFGPWMYAIARHRLYDAAAQQRRRRETEVLARERARERTRERIDELGRQASQSIVEGGASAGLLRRALAHLSKNQREVIRMLKLEDRSVAEISELTGLTVSSVKVTAHRGYKKLRKLMASTGRG